MFHKVIIAIDPSLLFLFFSFFPFSLFILIFSPFSLFVSLSLLSSALRGVCPGSFRSLCLDLYHGL